MCAWQGACATDMLVLALVTSLGTVLLPARGFLRRLTLANQRRGGEGPRRDEARSQGVPERSRRAQRAQRACPNQGACPAPRRTSVQAQPHRLRSKRDAMRRPGAAGGCAAAVLGQRVRGRPVPKGMQELNQLHKCPGLRRNPWRWYEPAGPTGDRQTPTWRQGSTFIIATGPPRRPRALGRHDGPQATESCARKRVVGIFLGG